MSYKDYYAILGVPRGASHEEIQRAYKKLARKYHPDISKLPDADARFKELGEAYGVLKDEKKRALYDQHGEAWKAVSEGHAPPPNAEQFKVDVGTTGFDPSEFGDIGSIFEAFFGGGFGRGTERPYVRRERPMVGTDHEAEIRLTLEQGIHGGEHSIKLQDGVSGGTKSLTVRIPPGVRSGQRIRLVGQGGKGQMGGPDGDLYLRVHLAPHPVFEIVGSDLHTSLPVTPWEAALGTTVELQTLEGRLRVKVPAGSSSGRKIRLREKGYTKRNGGRGDLLAEIKIVVPKKLRDEERQLMERLARISTFHPRGREGRSS